VPDLDVHVVGGDPVPLLFQGDLNECGGVEGSLGALAVEEDDRVGLAVVVQVVTDALARPAVEGASGIVPAYAAALRVAALVYTRVAQGMSPWVRPRGVRAPPGHFGLYVYFTT